MDKKKSKAASEHEAQRALVEHLLTYTARLMRLNNGRPESGGSGILYHANGRLLGGEMPLAVIRIIYPDANRFASGMLGLLGSGHVQLLEGDSEIPSWRWRKALLAGRLVDIRVRITGKGTSSIG